MFKTGLVSVSFRGLSPNEIIKLCTENGLGLIEWGSDVHAPPAQTQKLLDITSLTEQNGLLCSSYGTYFRLGTHPLSELYAYIEAAKLLRTNIIRFWCGEKNYEEYTTEEKKLILSQAKDAAYIAEEAGITLCPECHNNTFTNTLDGALDLMNEVNSVAMRMYWQPNQYRTEEENAEYARSIAKYVKIIHVFNWSGKNKYPLADGVDIWQKYLSRFDGSQILLLEFMPDGKSASLPAEVAALRKIMRCFE